LLCIFSYWFLEISRLLVTWVDLILFVFISLYVIQLLLVHCLPQCVFFNIVVSLRISYLSMKHVALLGT